MNVNPNPASNPKLIGRSRELAALDALSHSDVLWIWGPPGVGKSRLASEWLSHASDAPITLDLSTCSSEEELLVHLAETLGVQGRPNEQMRNQWERLQAGIREGGRLLFLDNADGVRDVVDRFLAGTGVRAVVTSRSSPGTESHYAFKVEPLAHDAAVELFTATATRTNPDLVLDLDLIDRLSKRLDGLPLAIEFAARRTRMLTIEELVRRLEAGQGAPMDGIIRWMWRELDPELRDVVAQCSVFGDSFTVQAAESIVRTETAPVLDMLDELVTSSWLERAARADGVFRFRLLHTLRDFAIAETSPDDLSAAHDRALAYWTELGSTLRAEVEGHGGAAALGRLESERENLLEMAAIGLRRQDARALAILENLRWNACFVGPAFRYEELVKSGRQLASHCPDDLAARFLDFSATFARASGQASIAENDAVRASERAHAFGEPILRARAAITLGGVMSGSGRDEALAHLHEGLRLAEERGSAVDRGRALEQLGFCHLRRFELEDAENRFREAIDTFRGGASDLFASDSQSGLGWVLFRRGRVRAAVSRFAAALEDAERLGILARAASCTYNLAVAEHAAGELRDAANHIDAALRAWGRLGLDGYAPAGWVASARIYWDLEQPERAVRAARTAERLAPAARDLHNQGLAAGLTALFAWSKDGVPLDDDLFDTLSALDVHADPIAATAHLVGLVGMRASRGIPALRELNRAEEIAALVPETDEYVFKVLGRLVTIGHVFAQLCDAKLAGGATERALAASHAQRELETLQLPSDPRALRRSEPDFYVRLLLIAAHRDLQSLDAPQVALPPEFRHDVEFHANCHWVRIDGGEPIDLSSRKQLRVIMKALAKQYFANPTVLVSVEELLEVGWPGEVMTASSGRSRIYTAVRDLRKLGLDEIITTEEGGYRLASDSRFRVAPHTGILPPGG